jgi:hypothetical protein
MTGLTFKSPLPAIVAFGHKLKPYVGVLLFLFFAAIYGFTILRINSYSNPVIDESEVLAETKASPAPRIDKTAAQKLESLKDNSVNVQTLFEEGRTNPFDE